MKIKEASIKASGLSLLGIIALGGVGMWAGAEGGGAAQGAVFSFLAILPVLLFTSCIFPAIAHLTRSKFTIKKWVGLNLLAVLLLSTLTSVAIYSFAGGHLLGGLSVTFPLLLIGLIFPGIIWLWIAKSENKTKPNQNLHSIAGSARSERG